MSNFSNEVGSYQIAPNPFTWYTCATLPSVFFLYDKYAPHDLEHCILHLHWNKFKDDNSVHYQMAAAPPKKLSNITLKNHRTVCIKCLLAEFEQFFGHLLQVHSSQLPQMPHTRVQKRASRNAEMKPSDSSSDPPFCVFILKLKFDFSWYEGLGRGHVAYHK